MGYQNDIIRNLSLDLDFKLPYIHIMTIEQILSFILASAALTILPGPDNIFVLTQSLTRGKRFGLGISLGLVSGLIIHTFLAAFGISLLISQSPIAFSVIKYLGAAYLFYLAILALKEKPQAPQTEDLDISKQTSPFSLWKTGFIMNLLNPKVIIFFIAFFPQFIISEGMKTHWQMITLGLLFMAIALIIFSLISILAGYFSKYLNNSKFWKVIRWVKFIILAGIGIALLLTTS
jgi:threonine/homoserine/homoserine lactone efflux protein